jgi:hypothetical protein
VGDAPFAPHVYGFLGLPWIAAHVVWADGVLKENSRRELAARAHGVIGRELEALRDGGIARAVADGAASSVGGAVEGPL